MSSNIKADLFLDNESPVSYQSDNDGSIILELISAELTMVVKAPYYIADTVTRILKKFNEFGTDPLKSLIHMLS